MGRDRAAALVLGLLSCSLLASSAFKEHDFKVTQEQQHSTVLCGWSRNQPVI
jgi:hypothetical protein